MTRRSLPLVFALAAGVLLVAWWFGRDRDAGTAGDVRQEIPLTAPVSSSDAASAPNSRPANPGSGVPAPKLFLEMTVPERNRRADELKGLSAAALADRLFGLLQSQGDSAEADIALRLLIPKLQTELSDAERVQIYREMAALLADPDLPSGAKSNLIFLLGRTATPDALGILLQLAQKPVLGLEPLVLKMIRGTGDVQWGGRFHEELSPMLEETFRSGAVTPGLSEALTVAIAGVGAPAGLELLYKEALRGGRTVSEFTAQQGNVSWQALDVFRKVRNPAAVPLLEERLKDQPLEDLELVLSGTALAAMGRPEGTGALLGWAERANRDLSPLLEPWFTQVRDPDSFDLLEQARGNPERFKHRENWQALDRALRDWQERRQTTTPD